MMKKGIEVLNETHYYALIIKLSLNQHGKTWRECLQYEIKVRLSFLRILEKQDEDKSFEALQ